MVGFGQAKATHPFTSGQFGQVFLALGFRAVFVNGVHDQRTLNAHGAAIAAVYALNLSGYQAIADVVQTGATVALNGGAQEAHAAKLVHDFAIKLFVPRSHQNTGLQFFLAEVMSCINDGSFVVAQL